MAAPEGPGGKGQRMDGEPARGQGITRPGPTGVPEELQDEVGQRGRAVSEEGRGKNRGSFTGSPESGRKIGEILFKLLPALWTRGLPPRPRPRLRPVASIEIRISRGGQ